MDFYAGLIMLLFVSHVPWPDPTAQGSKHPDARALPRGTHKDRMNAFRVADSSLTQEPTFREIDDPVTSRAAWEENNCSHSTMIPVDYHLHWL